MKASQSIGKYIESKVAYLGQKMFALRDGKPHALEHGNNNKLCCIVARQHYYIEQVSYPVESIGDLTKIITLEYAEADNYFGYVIGDYVNEQRTVSIFKWINSDFVAPDQLNAQVYIPDILLLAEQYQEQVIRVNHDGTDYWTYLSTQGIHSTKVSPFMNSPAMFANAIGVPQSQTETEAYVCANDWLNLTALYAAFKSSWLKGFLHQIDIKKLIPAAAVVSFFSGAVIVYVLMMLSGLGFYSYKIDQLQQATRQDQGQITALFEKKQAVENMVTTINAMKGLLNQEVVTAEVWVLFDTLLNDYDAQIKQFSSRVQDDGSMVVLMLAEVDKASEVLSTFSNLPFVSQAQFTSDVVKVRDKESFRMELIVAQGDISDQ